MLLRLIIASCAAPPAFGSLTMKLKQPLHCELIVVFGQQADRQIQIVEADLGDVQNISC
jgi:hypothetical protein